MINDNEKIIKKINGDVIVQGPGRFDNYCVYLYKRTIPKDMEILSFLVNLSKIYSSEKIFADFMFIYDNTNKEINEEVLATITTISKNYPENHQYSIDRCFSVLYLTMIAEENKERSKLGKRIKRLAIHQVLFENMLPEEAAKYSKGKKWRELDELCKERGF